MFAGEVFGSKDTFFFGLVGQHGSTDHITNGEDAWHVGFEMIVDDDSTLLVHLDACTVESELISVGLATSGDQDMICLQHLPFSALHWLNGDFSIGAMVLSSNDLVGSKDLDALLGQDLVECLRDFLIKRWHYFVKVLHDDDFGSEALVD